MTRLLPWVALLAGTVLAVMLLRDAAAGSPIPERVQRWQPLAERHAVTVWGHQQHVARIGALIERESGGRPDVCSGAGACGLMQFMRPTWSDMQRQYPVRGNRSDADASVYLGARYLAWLERAHRRIAARCERWRRVLASYNWGIGNVNRATRRGPDWIARAPRETRAYLAVLTREHDFRRAGWPGRAACGRAACVC